MNRAEAQDKPMQYSRLGRTGLKVSVAGLGCGGASRLGLSSNRSDAHAIKLIQTAMDRGVNLFDTSRQYQTHYVIKHALKDRPRENYILSTKESSLYGGVPITPTQLRAGIETSLKELGTDYLDIFLLASLRIGDYLYARHELVPVLERLRDEGKIRFFGLSEKFDADPTHRMLQRAMEDDCWDVILTGFNMINQTARDTIIQQAAAKDIGVMCMFAVRRALRSRENIREVMFELAAKGLMPTDDLDINDPLGFLLENEGAQSLQDAAYRFCRHEPGIHTTLFGTGDLEHLHDNIDSLLRTGLRSQDLQRLKVMFAINRIITGQ
ncbi:MAG: aldo/keto reductase [Hirschia sp.]|nr:aldo/keto reductase [Hirschia sp.]MBF19776.1 aldo/keto reductase [Hirschia sp.]